MWSRHRPRSAYDVMALVALFLAVGTGGSYAIDRIDGGDIADNSVRSADLRNGDVRSIDLARGSVRGSTIRDGAVRSADIGTGAVSGVDVANESLSATDVAGLTGRDLVPESLTGLQVGGLTGADVENDSLTGTDVANLDGSDIDGLTGADLADDSVPDEKLTNVSASDGVVKLQAGESAVLLEEEPFVVRGTCADDGAGGFVAEVTAETTEEGSVWHSSLSGSGVLPVGETRQLVNADGTEVEVNGVTFMLAAPSGTMITGYAGAGTNALGSPCFTLATALKGKDDV